jgi:hypothetical protein
MEHALHLAAKHFVEGVSPTSSSTLLNKVKAALANATSEDDKVDVAALNNELEGLGFDSEDSKEGKDEYFDVADTIGKALALVTQV